MTNLLLSCVINSLSFGWELHKCNDILLFHVFHTCGREDSRFKLALIALPCGCAIHLVFSTGIFNFPPITSINTLYIVSVKLLEQVQCHC